MNATSFVDKVLFTSNQTSLIDLENSNLPIDYFTSVLPRAQYGDESAVTVGMNGADARLIFNDPGDPSKGALFDHGSNVPDDTLEKQDIASTSSSPG